MPPEDLSPALDALRASLHTLKSDPQAEAARAEAMEASLDSIRANLLKADELRKQATAHLQTASAAIKTAPVIQLQPSQPEVK